MFIRDILRTKGTEIHTIGPDATADDVVRDLVRYNIGSLVVYASEGGGPPRMIGIITERDILRAQAAHRAPLERLLVRDVMSQHVITTAPDDPLQDAMRLMTNHRIRHLPVVDEDGGMLGIISIGDIVKAHHDELEIDNHYMKSYILGAGADVGAPM